MRTLSAGTAQLTEEFGIRIGRWTQYPQAGALPFEAMWCVVPPGSRTTEDCHPEVELAVPVDGSGAFEAGGETVDVSPGTVVLLSSNERHVIHNRSDDSPLVILSVYWMPNDDG